MILVAILNRDYDVKYVHSSFADAEATLAVLEERQKEERYPQTYTLKVFDAATLINQNKKFKSALSNAATSLLASIRDED